MVLGFVLFILGGVSLFVAVFSLLRMEFLLRKNDINVSILNPFFPITIYSSYCKKFGSEVLLVKLLKYSLSLIPFFIFSGLIVMVLFKK